MEVFEFLGQWWVPPDQTKAIPGTLTFTNQDGIRLKLMGSFKSIPDVQSFKTYPIILGVTQDGKSITLSECIEIQSQFGFGGSNYSNQGFRIGSAYIGFHFADPLEIRFYKIEVQYSYLLDWASLPLVQVRVIPNERGGLGKYELTYTPPSTVMAKTAKGSVAVTSSVNMKNDGLQEASIHQSVWIEVEAQEYLSFEEWLFQFVGPLQNLVNLGTCKPNSLRTLRGYTNNYSIIRPDGEAEERPIQIVFQQHYVEPEISQRLFPSDMLFTLQDIIDDFGQIVENWLKVSEDLDSVYNLFFGIQYVERLYLDQKFLNIIQAVESYHRRRSNKQDLSDDQHKKRIEAILSGTPQEYKKWLATKLKYSNELSLRQRLKDLLNDKERNQAVLPLVVNKNAFIDRVVNMRNYLTHFDPSLKTSMATGEDLYRITQILTFLVQSCFLHELGITPQRSLILFRRNALYQFLLSRR